MKGTLCTSLFIALVGTLYAQVATPTRSNESSPPKPASGFDYRDLSDKKSGCPPNGMCVSVPPTKIDPTQKDMDIERILSSPKLYPIIQCSSGNDCRLYFIPNPSWIWRHNGSLLPDDKSLNPDYSIKPPYSTLDIVTTPVTKS